MNEMLGNQYFMARKYLDASTVFQKVLVEDPNNLNARKKLIIAYTQIGKFELASELFTQLLKTDPDYIINTDPIKDDCPCPELVYNLEKFTIDGNESFTTCQTLGILWLYCDIHNSIEYFRKAKSLRPNDENINRILNILEDKLQEIH